MLAHASRFEIILGSTLGSMGGVALTTDNLAVIGAVGSCVAAVVGGIAWIDRRIESRIKLYHYQNEATHQQIRAEVGHIKELLTVAGAIPALTPEPQRLEELVP